MRSVQKALVSKLFLLLLTVGVSAVAIVSFSNFSNTGLSALSESNGIKLAETGEKPSQELPEQAVGNLSSQIAAGNLQDTASKSLQEKPASAKSNTLGSGGGGGFSGGGNSSSGGSGSGSSGSGGGGHVGSIESTAPLSELEPIKIESGLVFYETFDDLNSIIEKRGYCSWSGPLCTVDSNIDFVQGLDGNAVQFGIEPVNFLGPINYQNYLVYDVNYVGTVEFWVKPTDLGSIYNSDIYLNYKLGTRKSGNMVSVLFQYFRDYFLSVEENPLGWHKVGISWECRDTNHVIFFADEKIMDIYSDNCGKYPPRVSALIVGNPYISEPSYDAIDNLKVYSIAKTKEQITEEYRQRMPNRKPTIESFSPLADPIVPVGSVQEFSVTASDPYGLPLTYKWFVNGMQASEDSNVFLFSPTEDNREYAVKVVVSNGAYWTVKEWHVNPPNYEFMEGMNYVAWWYNQYSLPESDVYLEELLIDGVEWISILVTQYQSTTSSTEIYPVGSKTPTDESIAHAIATAKSLGYKVMLKPHVDPLSGWRGDISFYNEADWNAWFSSYKTFINHYAELANSNNVDLFMVGTELKGTSPREGDWREVIDGIRQRYSGILTYAANYDEYNTIEWWDAVEYIGIDAYFALTSKLDPTVAELEQAWQPIAQQIKEFSEENNKKILFTEIGYQSVDGTNIHPWYSTGAIDLNEQADAYNAFLNIYNDKNWVQGIVWWNWEAWGDQGGPADSDFTTRNKPAELVIRERWAGINRPPITVIQTYSFESGSEGWVFNSVPGFFSVPGSGWANGSLRLTSVDANTFGFWASPSEIQILADKLYFVRYKVSTDESDPARVPQIRPRYNAQSEQKAAYLVVPTAYGQASAAPTVDGRNYYLFFKPPESSIGKAGMDKLYLSFDLTNFDVSDNPTASVFLQEAEVSTIETSSVIFREVKRYTFDYGEEGWTHFGAPLAFNEPSYSNYNGMLKMTANDKNTFGFWRSPNELPAESGKLYRLRFKVSSDVADREKVPQFRLRVNLFSEEYASVELVTSNNGAESSPVNGEVKEYESYFTLPENTPTPSPAGMYVSFDLVNIGVDEQADTSIMLDELIVEEAVNLTVFK